MRSIETYANKDTYCSICEKKIFKKDIIILFYDKNKLLGIKCCDCYIKNRNFKD